ncbi:TRAP transporter large permease [Aquibacillus sediminis]|uniref:TRAP transporter large permease n=1 Tax=Aquibacillus sediminis TaxID=2574734 RepID=UPI001109C6FC|nr:TRAP transporter large permease [Aquibacillus sediminis]
MSPELIGVIGIIVLLVLLFLKVPVSISLIFVGTAGFGIIRGFDTGLIQLGNTPFGTASSYSLSVIPLFILMGMILSYSGLGQDLFRMVDSWIGHIKGGLALTTIGTSAIFASISGSVNATTAAMARITLPEMKKYNYKPAISTASVAAGGTLGILIPPSVILILYGVMTMEPIGDLLIAGIIPGIVQVGLFMLVISLWVRKDPDAGPQTEKSDWKTRFKSISKVWPFAILFVVSIGGIYLGIFTPTEAGAVGAFGALLLALITRRIDLDKLKKALSETTRLSAMIFLILIGADIFSKFLAISRIPMNITAFINGLDWSPIIIISMILVVYLILGMFLETIAILAMTLPVVYPIITQLGFDGVWFGVIMIIVMNIGLITPPLGLSVYIISGVMKEYAVEKIFRWVVPMLAAMVFSIVLFLIFPQFITILPSLMRG